ncbi:MAG: hypothetical protein LC808_24975 [Actinobacteria bacterium]|nr:hypothetical protein [Actinomycetota bacterium]
MDHKHALAIHSLDIAFDALQAAAAELCIASALAASPALRSDARVLADAVELELLAVSSILLRHGCRSD